MKLRGFIHVCQLPGWERSFKLLLDALNSSGLYAASDSIVCGVVHNGHLDTSFADGLPKLRVVDMGNCNKYERPTLQLMLNEATASGPFYAYYLHTKGLRWWGTSNEGNVRDWIDLMLYWNVEQWRNAVQALARGYDTYGCNESQSPSRHYSGNFWWATSAYLQRLPQDIGTNYLDPEMWLLQLPDANAFCAFRSNVDHYWTAFKRAQYAHADSKSFR